MHADEIRSNRNSSFAPPPLHVGRDGRPDSVVEPAFNPVQFPWWPQCRQGFFWPHPPRAGGRRTPVRCKPDTAYQRLMRWTMPSCMRVVWRKCMCRQNQVRAGSELTRSSRRRLPSRYLPPSVLSDPSDARQDWQDRHPLPRRLRLAVIRIVRQAGPAIDAPAVQPFGAGGSY